ncbi:MAG: HD domain-containing protein, partial [Gaiellales bacterium]
MSADLILDPVRERILDGMRSLPLEEIYEVGGSLRDGLLGRQAKDVDFLVRGRDIDELIALLRRFGPADELRVAGRLVGVRFRPSFGPKEGIEVVPPRRETPIRPGEEGYTGNPHTDFRIEPDPQLSVRDDLERRDFTVNAMAREIRTDVWIDPFGGRTDLAAGILRAVHPTAFRDDPLRVLRGVARCAIDGLVPDPATRALMVAESPRIAELSAERVRDTIDQTLMGEAAADGLRFAREIGALAAALPEWQACVGVPQRSSTQAYTVDEHILHVLEQAVLERGSLVLRLAALWHDVGKAFADGPVSHAEESARIADRALRRLAYDNDTRLAVVQSVREHPYDEERDPTPASARRFLARVGREAAPDLLALRRCDRLGRGFDPQPEDVARRGRFEALVAAEWNSPVTRAELAVSGDDLLAAGVSAGPALGRLLALLLDYVVEDPSRNTPAELLRQ